MEQSLRPQPDRYFFLHTTILPLRPSCSPEPDGIPTREDHRARFYKVYHKGAKAYDKEFLQKHDEDLNTTLIFLNSRGF